MHKLEIRNFGPINEANIEVGDLTVIIGEQATGKSTISKLIYFFQSLKEDALKSALHGVETQANPSSIFKRELQQKFHYFFKPAYFQPDTHIKYFFSKSQWFEVKIGEKIENEVKLGNIGVSVDARPIYWKEISNALFSIEELLQKRTTKSILSAVQTPQAEIRVTLDKLFPDCREGLYIPAGRNISVGHSEQFEQYFRDRLILGLSSGTELIQTDENRLPTADMFLLENFMNRVAEIKDEFRSSGGGFTEMVQDYAKRFVDSEKRVAALKGINQRITQVLRGEYRADGSAERIQFGKNKFVWLREASSGQQESIRIMQDMMLLTRAGYSVFRAIEEPEAHLFPLAQQYLVELIALAQITTESRFVLTTHSPYIISALNNILFDSQLAQNTSSVETPKIIPDNLRGYMLTRDLKTGAVKCESLLKDVGRENFPLILMGHTSLDTVAEQMGSTFSELRSRYRNQSLAQPPEV